MTQSVFFRCELISPSARLPRKKSICLLALCLPPYHRPAISSSPPWAIGPVTPYQVIFCSYTYQGNVYANTRRSYNLSLTSNHHRRLGCQGQEEEKSSKRQKTSLTPTREKKSPYHHHPPELFTPSNSHRGVGIVGRGGFCFLHLP